MSAESINTTLLTISDPLDLILPSIEEDNKWDQNINVSAKLQRPTPAWLSAVFRLDKFNNKEQTFTVTSCINVHWKMDLTQLGNILANDESAKICTPHSREIPSRKKTWFKIHRLLQNPDREISSQKPNTDANFPTNISEIKRQQTKEEALAGIGGNIVLYTNDCEDRIIKIVDLRDSEVTNFVPINAREIFRSASIQNIDYKAMPAFYYNTQSKLAHIRYEITATLYEHMELNDYPFDRQFFNIQINWNWRYFRLIKWKNTNSVDPSKDKWWGEHTINSHSYKMYYTNPLKVHISEELRSEIELLETGSWVDFDHALIKLRIKRNPTNFCLTVLIPFFIIVSCSFTIFAIDSGIADRLGVSVTILLTFTAFQNMVDEELPKSSETEFIDKYILLAYVIQGLIIIGTCLLPYMFDEEDDIFWRIEAIWALAIVVIWIGPSVFYVLKASNVLKDQKKDIAFWQERAEKEDEYGDWEETIEVNTKFYLYRNRSKNIEQNTMPVGPVQPQIEQKSSKSRLLVKKSVKSNYNSTVQSYMSI